MSYDMATQAFFTKLGIPSGTTYVGFLDTYSGATFGLSTKKLMTNYNGYALQVTRASDGATLNIPFDVSGNANVAAFNAFVAGTVGYCSIWYDQVGGNNAIQPTLSKMPRIIVGSNGMLAVVPQPGSSMTTSYNAAVNTPKQHFFGVVMAAYADNRASQSGIATISVTGNVASGSPTISSMSSQAGISTANGGVNPGTLPGVADSAGFLPNASPIGQTYLTALPNGSTATLAFSPGDISPTGSQTGDGLTFTNAVLSGAWIINGPASSTYYNSAYWGIGIGSAADPYPCDWTAPRNGSGIANNSNFQSVIGQGMRGQWAVYDYDTFTTHLNYNGVSLGQITGTTANITYSTNVGMTLFSDANGVEQTSQSCFEAMILFPSTQVARIAMAETLMSEYGIAFPFASITSDGFSMNGLYQPGYTSSPNSVYGQYSTGPDAWGLTWNVQSGGYTWPSAAYATNINNSATMWRLIVEQGDSDTNITAAERAEISSNGIVTPGQNFSFFYQFEFEQLPNETGDWCASGQIHYNNVTSGANSPDLVSFSAKDNQVQFVTQKTVSGNTVTTNQGAPFALAAGTTYAVVGTGFWSSNHTSDTLQVWAGVNGGTLSSIFSIGPSALWDNDTGAYLKAGIYRGYPWSNAGTVVLRVMNMQFSTIAGAYASYITAQPSLPTHA